jgi:hypothetical protein
MRSADYAISTLRTAQNFKSVLCFGLGFPKARNPVARFPLPTLFEERDALKALHDVAFCA